LIAEQKLQTAGDKGSRDIATFELARFQRLFADQYEDLAANDGLEYVEEWLAQNPPYAEPVPSPLELQAPERPSVGGPSASSSAPLQP
jgi:hypothetical protein